MNPLRSSTLVFPLVMLLVTCSADPWRSCATVVPGTLAATDVACGLPGDHDETVMIDGATHRFRVHVPATLTSGAPMVVQLHGAWGTGCRMERVTGLAARGEQEGFVVVSPEGASRSFLGMRVWNAGDCRMCRESPDHVAAIDAMIDRALAVAQCVDEHRVYVAGQSNGGMMAYRYACERSERLAGIIVSAGTLLDGGPSDCNPTTPVPILHVHGVQDACVPLGGQMDDERRLPSIEEVMANWRVWNRCAESPTDATVHGVRRRMWSCAEGSRVELVTIADHSHPWAGALVPSRNRCSTVVTNHLSTTDELVRFLGLTP